MSSDKFLSDFLESLNLFIQNISEVFQSLSDIEKIGIVGLLLSVIVTIIIVVSRKKHVEESRLSLQKKRTPSGACAICLRYSSSLIYDEEEGYICKKCDDLRKKERLKEKEVMPEDSEVEEPSLEEPYHPDELKDHEEEEEPSLEEPIHPDDLKDSEDQVPEPKILDIQEKSVSEKGTRARESSEFIRDTDTSFIRGEYKEEKTHVEKPKILKSKLESKKDDSLQEEAFHPDDLKNSKDRVPEPKILAVPENWRIPEKSKEEPSLEEPSHPDDVKNHEEEPIKLDHSKRKDDDDFYTIIRNGVTIYRKKRKKR